MSEFNFDKEMDKRNAEYLENQFGEPKGPFTVELYVGMRSNYGWELWQSDIEEYQDAVSEAQILEDHGFEWRIISVNNKEFHPNLKARNMRRVA